MNFKKLSILCCIVMALSLLMLGCQSAYLTGAKVALQETPPAWDRAEELVQKALTDTPQNWEAHLYMGLVHTHFKRYEEAADSYEKAKELAPDEKAKMTIDRKRFENAVRLMKQKNYDVAAREVEDIDMDVAENSSELYNIGILYLNLAKSAEKDELPKEREKYLDKAKKAFQQTVDLAEKEVNLSEDNKRLSESDKLQIRKQAATAYSGLGIAYSSAGGYEEAANAYERAIELDPESEQYKASLTTARLNLGVNLIEAEKFDEAIAYYEGLLEKDPGFSEAYYFIGKTYLEKADKLAAEGQEDAAVEAEKKAVVNLEAAVEANPKDYDTLFELYRIFMKSEMYAEAKGVAQKMVNIYPEVSPVTVYTYLGRASQELGTVYSKEGKEAEAQEEYQIALENFQKYIDAEPNDPMGYMYIGAVYTKMGQPEKAQEAFQKSNELQNQ
jgi:tetratricopeptide (TPR) repeat protein